MKHYGNAMVNGNDRILPSHDGETIRSHSDTSSPNTFRFNAVGLRHLRWTQCSAAGLECYQPFALFAAGSKLL